MGKPKSIKMKDLPEEWNWENVDGVDFTGNVKNQGACGSCF